MKILRLVSTFTTGSGWILVFIPISELPTVPFATEAAPTLLLGCCLRLQLEPLPAPREEGDV